MKMHTLSLACAALAINGLMAACVQADEAKTGEAPPASL